MDSFSNLLRTSSPTFPVFAVPLAHVSAIGYALIRYGLRGERRRCCMRTQVAIRPVTMLLSTFLLAMSVNAHASNTKASPNSNAANSASDSTNYDTLLIGARQQFNVAGEPSLAAAESGSCAAWTKCPIDGAQSNLVNTEYEGLVAVGVYEHTTSTGETHRFRLRCN